MLVRNFAMDTYKMHVFELISSFCYDYKVDAVNGSWELTFKVAFSSSAERMVSLLEGSNKPAPGMLSG